MATHAQDPTKIRNIAIIAHVERCAFETPILGFSTRRQNGIHFVGLLFPAGGKL